MLRKIAIIFFIFNLLNYSTLILLPKKAIVKPISVFLTKKSTPFNSVDSFAIYVIKEITFCYNQPSNIP